jgi:hypothetical protein
MVGCGRLLASTVDKVVVDARALFQFAVEFGYLEESLIDVTPKVLREF